MIEADAPSTEEATLVHRGGARPTGDSHALTTRGPAQRGEGAKEGRAPGRSKSAAKGHYKGRSPKAPPEVLEELR